MVYIIQACWLLASRIRMELSWSCSQAVSKPVQHIPLLCVQWKTPDDGERNCLQHAEFYSKNKFEKLAHLVGFTTRKHTTKMSPSQFDVPVCWDSHHYKINKFILLYKCHIYLKKKIPQPIIVNALISKHTFMILIIKANKMHYFSNLFDKVLYMFWTSPLSIIRSISTLYTRNRYSSC